MTRSISSATRHHPVGRLSAAQPAFSLRFRPVPYRAIPGTTVRTAYPRLPPHRYDTARAEPAVRRGSESGTSRERASPPKRSAASGRLFQVPQVRAATVRPVSVLWRGAGRIYARFSPFRPRSARCAGCRRSCVRNYPPAPLRYGCVGGRCRYVYRRRRAGRPSPYPPYIRRRCRSVHRPKAGLRGRG